MFRIAWKNLFDKPLSSLLSLVLFALGAGLVALLLLLNRQLSQNFERNLAGIDLVIGAKGSPLQLILCSMYHVDAPTGNISLAEAKPFLNPAHPLIKQAVPLSLGDSYEGHRIVGTRPDFLELYTTDKAPFSAGKIFEKPFETIIGAAVAEKTGLKMGQVFASNHGFSDDTTFVHEHGAMRVVGILKPTATVLDQLVLTPTETVWAVHSEHGEEESHENHDHDGDGKADHEAHEHFEIDSATAEITSILVKFKGRNFQTLNMPRQINENTNLQAASPAWEMNRLYANIGAGETMLWWLTAVIIGVSALSVFIALFNSLRDRRYELALLRVMGAGRGRLFWLIILEGLLLALAGCALGLLLAHVGMEAIGRLLESSYRYHFTGKMWLREEFFIVAGSVILGLLAAILPAFQAYRMEISKTLAR